MKITRTAQRQLRRMDVRYANRLKEALLAYEKNGTGDVRNLVDRPGYRLRVGDYRAIFEVVDGAVVVLEVGPRGSVY